MDEKMEKASFEQRLEHVQNVITQIEEGKLSLEDSVKQYEAGMSALRKLEEELKEINRRITVLQDGPEGPEEVPMTGEA